MSSGVRFMFLLALAGMLSLTFYTHYLIQSSSSQTHPKLAVVEHAMNEEDRSESKLPSKSIKTNQCTAEQFDVIKKQLPSDDCLKYKGQPWMQKCSLTYATRCPETTWLENHYTKLHKSNKENQQGKPFVGLFIGCNKGMDAVSAMRMGSANPIFDKSSWRNAITKNDTVKLSNSVCKQDKTKQYEIQHEHDSRYSETAFLHCVEAMPGTAMALKEAAHELSWDDKGFVVTHAAMSKNDGFVPFPSSNGVGIENQGIGNCVKNPSSCVNVTMYSLDTFVSKFVPESMPINYLSVDVEGFDMDVLLGGLKTALPRTQYLEFEYNWVGSWGHQHLNDLVTLLDQRGFTCYWPGFDNNIWRITGCWLDFYDTHVWSNVACVNRNMDEVKSMAEDMELLFHNTIAKDEHVIMDHAAAENFRNREI